MTCLQLSAYSLQRRPFSRTLTRNVLLWVVLLQLYSFGCLGQVTGRITDKDTGAPVAFANVQVEHGTAGTTAAEDGSFSLDAAVTGTTFLIISSVGYERTRVRAADVANVKLMPQAQLLSEVVVRRPGKGKKQIIGSFKKSDLRSGFGTGSRNTSPWIIARYFPYKPEYEQTPFIEELTLVTRSDIPDARFRLRIMRATTTGTPGNDLLQTPLLVSAPRGNRAVTVNLHQHHIQVPPEGFFIAFEWLLIPGNIKVHTYRKKDGTKKTARSYEPTLAARLVPANTHTWIYTGGAWSRNYARHSDSTYSEPQFKVVLSE